MQTPVTFAQSFCSVADRLHGNPRPPYRRTQSPEACGSFIGLADAGHAPSAALALWGGSSG